MAKISRKKLTLSNPFKVVKHSSYRKTARRSRLGRNFKKTSLIFGLSLLLESIVLQIITSGQFTPTLPVGQVASVHTEQQAEPTPTLQPTRLPIFRTAVQAASQPTPTPTPPPPPPFKNPLNNYRITQYFSRYHTAIDLAASYGTPVYSTNQGTVLATGYLIPGGGLMIKVGHRDGYLSYYAHLSSIQVSKGAEVSRSTQIGRIGTTGWSTGPHLHFMMEQNGRFVNPLSVIK